MRNEKLLKMVMTALMAALSYVVFTFLQIKITLPAAMPLPSILETQSVSWAPFYLAVYSADLAVRSE